MKTLVELIKELFMLVIFIGMIDIALKLFLRRTLLGRLIAVLIKDIILFFKLFFRMSKHTSRLAYKCSKKTYKFLNTQYKKYSEKKHLDVGKVVNGNSNNIIDLKQYLEEKRNKNV